MYIRVTDSSKRPTITLNDGTKLTNLSINYATFIAQNVIDINVFKNNLKKIWISDGTNEKEYENVYLAHYGIEDNEWSWFKLGTKNYEYIASRSNSISDIQLALTEIYEFIIDRYEFIIDKNIKEGL